MVKTKETKVILSCSPEDHSATRTNVIHQNEVLNAVGMFIKAVVGWSMCAYINYIGPGQ